MEFPTLKVKAKAKAEDVELMVAPTISAAKSKSIQEILNFAGFNSTAQASESEFLNTKNLSARKYPRICERLPRTVQSTLTTPNALFASGKLCWVDGTQFYYDGTAKGTVVSGKKSMVDINGCIVIFPDKKYYDYVLGTFGSFTAPDIDYAVTWNNRVWGVYDQEIVASKLGDFKTWDSFNGLASDSYATNVDGNAVFTGISLFQNHITIFQGADKFYEIYGDRPENFSVVESSDVGTTNDKAVIEVNSILYFLSRSGLYAYGGGSPRLISTNIEKEYRTATLGRLNEVLYASLYDGTVYDLFTYDTVTGIWYREDDLNVVDFTTMDGYLYGLTSTGSIIKFNSGTETIAWEAEFQPMDFRTTEKKYLSKVSLRMDITGTVNLYIKYDKGAYSLIKTISPNATTSLIEVPVMINICDSFQLKLTGSGTVELREIYRTLMVGG